MPLERINPNTIYPPVNNNYTQVVRSTGSTQVHVAGILGLDIDGKLAGEGDMRTQTRVTMENIVKALHAGGAKPTDVARIMIFTTDVDTYLKEGHQEVLAVLGEHKAASTLLGVARLARPEFLVEIHVTAVLD